jgi:alginate production protein
VRFGRQRVKEDRGLWWNRDFDAISVIYDASLFEGKLTVGQNLAEYRTSNDTFNQDNQDIFRVLAETSWQWKYGQYFETRFAYQHDYSEMENVGSIINGTDRDESDADLFWGGVRVKGDIGGLRPELEKTRVNYRVDLMAVAGSDDVQTSTSGPGDRRTVSALQENDVFGWGLDAELSVPLPVPTKPLLILGYAFGSGDEDSTDTDDDAFRQTGLDGNTSRPGIATGSLHNYGSILRPDLSNIHIVTAGLTIPFTPATDLTTMYHFYHLDEEDASIPTSGIDAPLNGTDSELGHGLDVMLNMDLTKQFGIPDETINRVALKTTLGAFKAGEAYGLGEDETAYRGQVELRFRF